jgi:L-fuconolactonase
MRIDSHQHFWKYNSVRDSWITQEMGILRKDFLPGDLQPLLQRNKFDGCVAVQSDQSENETDFLLKLASSFDFIKGIVGWINLKAHDLDERLEYYKQFSKLKGFRHIVQDERKGFLLDPEFIAGVKALSSFDFTYDLLIRHHQLDEALKFVQSLKGVKIVVDHIAKPSIITGEKTHWELNMASLASFPNVYCKVSGMVTEGDWDNWKKEDFHPFLDEVLEIFGPDRMIYGSDWPVCLLAASYEEQLQIVQEYISKLSESEQEKIMGGNCIKFYNL